MRDSPESQIAMPLSRERAGLPRGQAVRVVHSAAANMTVLEWELEGTPPLHRLFWRLAGQSTYALVADPGPNRSLENMVGCDARWLFARLTEWSPVPRGFGSTTLGLARVALDEPPNVEIIDLGRVLPVGGRLAKLLRAGDAGTALDVVVLREEPTPRGGTRARYLLGRADLAAGRTLEFDTLPGLHF